MNPGRYNISVYQGTTFELSPQWLVDNLPVDITGYTADMQVRDVSNNLLVDASTANGKIVLTPTQGIINITILASATAGYAAATYSYALNITAPDGITVYQILNGTFLVSASVVQ